MRSTNCTPFTTRPAWTSRQAMMRLVIMLWPLQIARNKILEFIPLSSRECLRGNEQKPIFSYVEQCDSFVLGKVENGVPEEFAFAESRYRRDNSVIIDINGYSAIRQ